jgi:hypothetical protein
MKAPAKPEIPAQKRRNPTVSFRMQPAHLERLDRAAAEMGLDRGAVIQLALNAFLPSAKKAGG